MSNLAQVNDINLKVFDEICEERFSNIDINKVLVAIIDNVPSSALPHLAEQYHITGNEGWLYANTELEKRNLIKSAIKIHRYKGTKYAIEEIFKTLNIIGKVTEWFEYGGAPYHFTINFDIERAYDDAFETSLLELVNENKNVRSVLEKLIINLTRKTNAPFGSAVVTSEEVLV